MRQPRPIGIVASARPDMEGRFRFRLMAHAAPSATDTEGTAHIPFRVSREGSRTAPLHVRAAGLRFQNEPSVFLAEFPLEPGTYRITSPAAPAFRKRFRVPAGQDASLRELCVHTTGRSSWIDASSFFRRDGEFWAAFQEGEARPCCTRPLLEPGVTVVNLFNLNLYLPLDLPLALGIPGSGKARLVRPGEYAIVNPADRSVAIPVRARTLRLDCAEITQAAIRHFREIAGLPKRLGPLDFAPGPRRLTPPVRKAVDRFARALRQASRGPDTDDYEAVAAVNDLLMTLVRNHPNGIIGRSRRAPVPASPDPRVARAVAYLKMRFQAPFDGRELARHASLSVPRLWDLFKRELGTTPNDYVQGLRIEEAKRLLADRSLPIREVALAVGYADVRSFRRVFKAHARRQIRSFRGT